MPTPLNLVRGMGNAPAAAARKERKREGSF
ncbi:hypothetical protein NONI108955_18640 [Nocardia ninae]